jgi:hypothetical protein
MQLVEIAEGGEGRPRIPPARNRFAPRNPSSAANAGPRHGVAAATPTLSRH